MYYKMFSYIYIIHMHVMQLRISPCSYLVATSEEESILECRPGKKEHGDLVTKIKTRNFLKMAPQAKPLCS